MQVYSKIIFNICLFVWLLCSNQFAVASPPPIFLNKVDVEQTTDSSKTRIAGKVTQRSFMTIYRGTDISVLPVRPQKTDSPQEKSAKELVMELLQKNSPAAFYMVKRYYEIPDVFYFDGTIVQLAPKDDLLTWVDALDEENLIQTLNTTVHEISHGYIARSGFEAYQKEHYQISENDRYFHFYINKEQQFLVPYTPVMLTRDMHATFPKKLQRDRYPIYVYPSEKTMGSQVNGVYGLLDEFNAYYMGTLAAFDMYPFFLSQAENTPEIWLDYINTVSSTFYAYAEFKLYIVHYLWHVKKFVPAVYEQILQNSNFINAFLQIDAAYFALANNWIARMNKIIDMCKTAGVAAQMDEDYFYIKGTGYGHFKKEYYENLHELLLPKYQAIINELQQQ